ncbi:MAG: copper resistance protein NlpE [Clostridiales bacterium]|nr:copper resistance protein NlpE [Clostridiales bacterium]
MKKRINSPLLVGILSLLALFSGANLGELKEITKPHLGVYECTEARLAEQNFLDRFDKIELELNADETFTLYYCEKGGRMRKENGRYQYDREKETLTLMGGPLRKEFPLKQGMLTLYFTMGKEPLMLIFKQKS